MRKFKGLFAVLMAMAMMLAMSSMAFAADNRVNTDGQTGTVTVYFTRDCSYSYDETDGTIGYDWIGDVTDPTLLKDSVGAQTVTFAELNGMIKGYEDGNTNPFGTKASVMDAIYYLGQQNEDVVTLDCGWSPAYDGQEAGAYVHNVDNQELTYDSTPNGDGTYTMTGTGFYVSVLKDGEATPYFPTEYVSNVALEDGMTIFVDFGMFGYGHQKLD